VLQSKGLAIVKVLVSIRLRNESYVSLDSFQMKAGRNREKRKNRAGRNEVCPNYSFSLES